MSNSSRPTYIYKLVPSSSPVLDELPVSDIDKNSGFIHLSTASHVPGTLKFFFVDDTRVYVLRLRYDALEGQIRWEDAKGEVCGPRGGEGMFPHLYNGLKLGKAEVESVLVLERGDAEAGRGWDEALKKDEAWLVC